MAGIGIDRATLAEIIAGKITPESGLSPATITQIADAVAAAIDENNAAIERDIDD